MSTKGDRPEAVDRAAEALYGAPYSTFTDERTRLTKELRAAGDKAGAALVAKLPRPPMSAWVVNRMYRDAPEELEALFAAAQRVAGGERQAADDHREWLDRLRERAAGILTGDGHAASEGTLRRVATTLRALAAQGTFAPDRPGQLLADRDPPGFEAMLMAAAAPAARPAKAPADVRPPDTLPERPARPSPGIRLDARAANDDARRAAAEEALERQTALALERERKRERAKEKQRAAAELVRLEEDLRAARRIAEATRRTLDDLRTRLARAETSDAEARARLEELDDGIARAQARVAELGEAGADDDAVD